MDIYKISINVYNNISNIYRASSAINPPYVTYLEDNCKTEECFKGIFADVWHALSKKMNFTYTIRIEKVYGSLINGSWKGMIGIFFVR